MPYAIRKSGAGYKVVKKATGEAIPGTSASRAKAVARIRAIAAHEHGDRKDYDADVTPAPSGCGGGGGCGCSSCGSRRQEYAEESETPANPFAVCHASVGPRKSDAYERCVRAVKKKQATRED